MRINTELAMFILSSMRIYRLYSRQCFGVVKRSGAGKHDDAARARTAEGLIKVCLFS